MAFGGICPAWTFDARDRVRRRTSPALDSRSFRPGRIIRVRITVQPEGAFVISKRRRFGIAYRSGRAPGALGGDSIMAKS